jgi:hypothetical protein
VHACVREYLEICARVYLCGKIDLEIFRVYIFVQNFEILRMSMCVRARLCTRCKNIEILRLFLCVYENLEILDAFVRLDACV